MHSSKFPILLVSLLFIESLTDVEAADSGFYCQQATTLKGEIEDLQRQLAYKTRRLVQFTQACTAGLQEGRHDTFMYRPNIVNCDLVNPQVSKDCLKKGVDLQFKTVGVSLFFTSSVLGLKASWWGAVQWCRSRGLLPATMDLNTKEMEELFDNTKIANSTEVQYWTGGSGWSKIFSWWDGGNQTENIMKITPNSTHRCLTIKSSGVGKVSLEMSNCRLSLPFLCHVPRACYSDACYNPTGIKKRKIPGKPTMLFGPAKDCSSNPVLNSICRRRRESAYFNNGILKIDSINGTFFRTCGKEYYIGSELTSIYDSVQMCCELGMVLASVETLNETNCIANFFAGQNQSIPVYLWTNANMETCTPGVLSAAWCGLKRKLGTAAPWVAGEPACNWGMERCIKLFVAPYATGLMTAICDTDDEGAFGFCESESSQSLFPANAGDVTITSAIFPPKNLTPKLSSTPYKPSYKAELEKQESCETLISKCNSQVPPKKVWELCCTQGLVPATFKDLPDIRCAIHHLRDDSTTYKSYFLAAADYNADRNFSFCKKGRNTFPISLDLFLQGEPNNYRSVDGCFILIVRAWGLGGIGDTSCDFAQPVLCEDPNYPPPSQNSSVRIVQSSTEKITQFSISSTNKP